MPKCSFVWLALLASFSFSVACQKQVKRQIPSDLLGVWETRDPRYADRFFELRSDQTIRFGQGEARVEMSPVTGVAIDHEGTSLVYRIEYLNEAAGEHNTVSLRYEPARSDELTFVHQPFVVWKRSSSSVTRER